MGHGTRSSVCEIRNLTVASQLSLVLGASPESQPFGLEAAAQHAGIHQGNVECTAATQEAFAPAILFLVSIARLHNAVTASIVSNFAGTCLRWWAGAGASACALHAGSGVGVRVVVVGDINQQCHNCGWSSWMEHRGTHTFVCWKHARVTCIAVSAACTAGCIMMHAMRACTWCMMHGEMTWVNRTCSKCTMPALTCLTHSSAVVSPE